MATSYTRVRTITEISAYSDYSNPVVVQTEATDSTVLVSRVFPLLSVPTSGTTITASGAATAWKKLVVENTDTTNYVTVAYTSVGSAGSVTIKVPAGQAILLGSGELNHSNNIVLTANTATVVCNVVTLES